MADETLPINTMDFLIIKWKKLASWDNPTYSGLAVSIVTIVYLYLNLTDATTLNLALWAIVAAYLSTTFATTIWPEVMLEQKSDPKSDIGGAGDGEDAIPVTEISFMVEETKNYFTVLKDLRSDSPGLFCTLTSGVFVVLLYFGSYISVVPLLYMLSMSGLVMPIVLRKLCRESPWIVEKLEVFKTMAVAVIKDFMEKVKAKTQERKNVLHNSAQQYIAILKQYFDKTMPTIKEQDVSTEDKQDKNENLLNGYEKIQNPEEAMSDEGKVLNSNQ